MIVEALQPHTFVPPESPGASFYAETTSRIAPDDHPAFQSMVAVMEGYTHEVLDGRASLPEGMHSEDDLLTVMAATEHQRRHAFWLRQGAVAEHDDEAVYAMGQGGTFERLVVPEVIYQPWAEISPPPISELQMHVLRQAIAGRAPHTIDEAEIAGLRYVCERLGIEQAFHNPEIVPDMPHAAAALLVEDATRCDLPVIFPQPGSEGQRWQDVPVRLAAALTVGLALQLHTRIRSSS